MLQQDEAGSYDSESGRSRAKGLRTRWACSEATEMLLLLGHREPWCPPPSPPPTVWESLCQEQWKWVALRGYLKHIGLDFPWKTEGSPEAGGPIGRHQEDFPMARCLRGNKVPQELYLSLGRANCSEAGDGWDKFWTAHPSSLCPHPWPCCLYWQREHSPPHPHALRKNASRVSGCFANNPHCPSKKSQLSKAFANTLLSWARRVLTTPQLRLSKTSINLK